MSVNVQIFGYEYTLLLSESQPDYDKNHSSPVASSIQSSNLPFSLTRYNSLPIFADNSPPLSSNKLA
jgi:hypothetical protein